MSAENVELARKIMQYWNRGDLDAANDLGDEDQMLRSAEGWPERVLYGRDAKRSFYEGILELVGGEVSDRGAGRRR